jgi:hypothetical protein
MMVSSATATPTPAQTPHIRKSYCYYDTTITASSPLPPASTHQKHKFNSHPGHQSGGYRVLLSSNTNNSNNTNTHSINNNSNISNINANTLRVDAVSFRTKQKKEQQRRKHLTDIGDERLMHRLSASGEAARSERRSSSCGVLYYRYMGTRTTTGAELQNGRKNDSSTTASSRRRKSLMHVGGTGTEDQRSSGQKNVYKRGTEGRRSNVCFAESVLKTLEAKSNAWSNIVSSTFHKDYAALKVSEQGFLLLLHNHDWLCLQKQYLDTERGLMVLFDLVMMNRSKFQELLLSTAGQPDMDVAGISKSVAPALLHLACAHKAPWVVVHRIFSLAPCSAYCVYAHTGQNVLHVAVQQGCSLQVLDLFIHLAPELASQKDDLGRFPLHYLCMPLPLKEQQPKRESLLLSCGDSMSNFHTHSDNIDNDNGTRLPRQFKSVMHRMLILKIVNQLCHAHPKATTTTDHHRGMNPLMYAVTHGAHADIIDRMMR